MSILTADEAAAVLRCASDDPKLAVLLPQVDAYIKRATGRDWALDEPVHEVAKAAARMMIIRAFEDPGALVLSANAISFSLPAVLLQLEAEAAVMGG